jgi:hypothetical protein
MLKKTRLTKAITPIQDELAAPEPIPDNPVLGVDMYSTPRCFKFGNSAKPIQIDADELSDALSGLMNTQADVGEKVHQELREGFPCCQISGHGSWQRRLQNRLGQSRDESKPS